jgi:putative glutamine amidotransferase
VRPVVGITAWPASVVAEHITVEVQAVPDNYFEVLDFVGLAALPLPVNGSAERAAELAARVDGLLLTGGGDVDPAAYAAPQRPQTAGVNRRRDDVEIELVRLACQRGQPILAVCRGIQLLNVALGGTLVQDLPTAHPPRPGHMMVETWDGAAHPVRLDPGTLLHRLLGPEITVNSLHHQAVDVVAPGMRVAARAPDGVIEAVENTGSQFVVGLQWHPEMLGLGHPSVAVFGQFASAASAVLASGGRPPQTPPRAIPRPPPLPPSRPPAGRRG